METCICNSLLVVQLTIVGCIQGSKGIRQLEKQFYTSPIISTPSLDYNFCLKRMDTLLNEPNNQNLIIVPKVVKPKSYYKTLRTSIINSPMSLPSLKRQKMVIDKQN